MRRLISIVLLAALALPLFAPVLALAEDSDAGLPACCRRHGQHHCTMLDARGDSSRHRFVAACAAWPQHAVPSPVGSHHFITRTSSAAISLRANFSAPQPSGFGLATTSERLHPKRGPPPESSAIS